mmetsp:Transcript_26196/g.65854  ORF Transcript_26196/g.65854 Transcript_26196/m.65854 type:complete len:233 (-) Transcript_26196:142-840(-)|eukprot:CAMPEP_0177667654 /NCGR_PEP_ID=MMETSP0447-20121125/22244_1 /TAXON_ID=0 /ORGANISM="Stygamoeba regulata, Strain BSH-02190019" /LENGTH=232 /DNA_ID=CAMNT_0019173911 /DNA_START=87 /DNA_END=785 /DNA_ORIENTATION=+
MSRHLVLFLLVLLCAVVVHATPRTVVLQFTDTSLRNIYAADEWIVLVRETDAGSRPVVWATALCFENSRVSWNDTELSAYVFPGLAIPPSSVFAASWVDDVIPGLVYPFNPSNTFGYPFDSSAIASSEVGVLNNSTELITGGLAQSYRSNEQLHVRAPIFADDLLENQHGVFTPSNRISVFLAKTTVQRGLVVGALEEVASSLITSFDFAPHQQTVTLAYDEESATFILLNN